MTSLINSYLSLNPLSKTGIGGAMTGAAYVGLGITNPLTLIAATAIGQGLAWMPDLARRCFRRAPAAPLAPMARPILVPRAVAQPQLSLKEELELQAVLEMSLKPDNDEKKQRENMDFAIARSLEPQPDRRRQDEDYDKAIAQSLGDADEDEKEISAHELQRVLRMSLDPEQQTRVCVLERTFKGCTENDPIEEDEIIPQQFLVDTGKGQYYHLGNLVLSLLSNAQGEEQDGFLVFKDALGKKFSADELEIFEARMGLNSGDLLNIWLLATLPQAPQDVNPDTQAARRSNYRMCLLRNALNARAPSQDVNKIRDSYLKFFDTKEVWTRLPADIRHC